MKTLQEDIKNKSFKHIYLIYGSESLLVRKYANALKKAALSDGDNDVNFSYFDEDTFEINAFIDSAQTMPFFADYRVVMLDGCSIGDAADRFVEYLENIPETTIIIMVLKTVDKKTKVYKAVAKYGYVCDLSATTPEMRLKFVVLEFTKAGKKITRTDADYFLEYVGGDLGNLLSEATKLIDYLGDNDVITQASINEICTGTIENRIYELITQICKRNETEAMGIYFDLMALKESPMRIVRLLMNEYLTLYSIFEVKERGGSLLTMAEAIHSQEWLVKKKLVMLRDMSKERLKASISLLTQTEEGIKTGNIDMNTGVEILLANLLIV